MLIKGRLPIKGNLMKLIESMTFYWDESSLEYQKSNLRCLSWGRIGQTMASKSQSETVFHLSKGMESISSEWSSDLYAVSYDYDT